MENVCAYFVYVFRYCNTHVLCRRQATPSTHIHAGFSGDQAVFNILNGEMLVGQFPQNKTRLVQAWIEIHREELLANWQLAVNGEEVFRIDPLK